MAVDMFLYIADIKGESVAANHQGEIDILSWTWGLTNKVTFTTGGLGTGKATPGELSVVHWVDKASPELMRCCAAGQHIPQGWLTVRKAGGKAAVEYLKIKLWEVFVTSVQNGTSHGDEHSAETVTLAFTRIEVTYSMQQADGSPKAINPFKWDIRTTEVT